MPAAALQLAATVHPGSVTGPCAKFTFINGMPAARAGDMFTCAMPPLAGPHPPNAIAKGSSSVLIEGMPAARVGDATGCGALIAVGSPNVMIGD
jgi:uncharacterized Zn-binding protein involved in type VI secretion